MRSFTHVEKDVCNILQRKYDTGMIHIYIVYFILYILYYLMTFFYI